MDPDFGKIAATQTNHQRTENAKRICMRERAVHYRFQLGASAANLSYSAVLQENPKLFALSVSPGWVAR
jgi:hypothetical protein